MKTNFKLIISGILLSVSCILHTDLKAQNANTTLSNLAAPTAVNKALLPVSVATIDLGSTAKTWRDIYLDGSLFLDGSKFLTNGTSSNSVFVGSLSGSTAIGSNNSFMGYLSGSKTTSGFGNTFLGAYAGEHNIAGSENVCIGYLTGAVGAPSDLGSNNTYVGSQITSWVPNVTNATGIGYNADVTVSNTARVGSGISRIGIGKECSSSSILEFSATSAKLSSGGTWTNSSDERLKENKEVLDKNKILDKVNHLSITRWNYKVDGSRKYIGPMAQDFHRLFEVGDDTTISTIDPAGIALLSIQALSVQINALMKQNADLQQQINELKDIVAPCQLPSMSKVESSANTSIPVLGMNIPNPFDSRTLIPVNIPAVKSYAVILITSAASGRLVRTIPVTQGDSFVTFEANDLPGGTYAYSLYIDDHLIDTKKMQILH